MVGKPLKRGIWNTLGLHAGLPICLGFLSVLDGVCVRPAASFLSTGRDHVLRPPILQKFGFGPPPPPTHTFLKRPFLTDFKKYHRPPKGTKFWRIGPNISQNPGKVPKPTVLTHTECSREIWGWALCPLLRMMAAGAWSSTSKDGDGRSERHPQHMDQLLEHSRTRREWIHGARRTKLGSSSAPDHMGALAAPPCRKGAASLCKRDPSSSPRNGGWARRHRFTKCGWVTEAAP